MGNWKGKSSETPGEKQAATCWNILAGHTRWAYSLDILVGRTRWTTRWTYPLDILVGHTRWAYSLSVLGRPLDWRLVLRDFSSSRINSS